MKQTLMTLGGATALVVASALTPVQTETTSILKTTLEGMEGMEANIVRFDVDKDWLTLPARRASRVGRGF